MVIDYLCQHPEPRSSMWILQSAWWLCHCTTWKWLEEFSKCAESVLGWSDLKCDIHESPFGNVRKHTSKRQDIFVIFFFSFFFFFFGFIGPHSCHMEAPRRGQIRATATGLRHSHSNVGFELHLSSTPQLKATPDPSPTEWGQGSNLYPHGY